MEEKKDILDFIKVKQGTTPDADYFDSLAQRIIEDETPIIQLPFYKNYILWSIIAAASVALIIVFAPSTSPNNTLIADLSSEEITQYIEENIDNFDAETIEEFVILETTNEAVSKPNSIEETLNELSEAEILDYFESENILDEFDDNELFI